MNEKDFAAVVGVLGNNEMIVLRFWEHKAHKESQSSRRNF